ncbi:MAG: pilus assembly protein PilM [Lentisphaeria bacterium]
MSIFVHHKQSLGLDLGSSSVKAVLLAHSGGRTVIRRALYLNRYQEGMLNEDELHQGFAEWLEKKNLVATPAVCGLSQYLTSEGVYYFPPEIRRGNLNKMVDFQSRVLGGITDESLIYDYQKLSTSGDHRNRVLIGAAREVVIQNSYEQLAELGVNVQGMAENGQALANAFVNIYPEESRRSELQMVLDIGRENTTVILFAGGGLQYITGLGFGSDLFSTALLQEQKSDKLCAGKEKPAVTLDWKDEKSPFFRPMHLLEGELASVIEHWKQSPNLEPKLSEQPLIRIWLTGCGALQPGLARRLEEIMNFETTLFGVPDKIFQASSVPCPDGFDFHPYFTLAYGLALQGIGQAPLKLSLVPRRLQWQQKRIREFPYLCGSVFLIFAMLAMTLFGWIGKLNKEIVELEAQKKSTRACLTLIPKIKDQYYQLQYEHNQILPFIEYGRRSHLFVRTLESCWRVLHSKENPVAAWGIYLADEFSFASEHVPIPEKEKPLYINHSVLENFPVDNKDTLTPLLKRYVYITKVPRLTKMYLGGIMEENEDRFLILKQIQAKFAKNNLFANIDDYTDLYHQEISESYLSDWRVFLKKYNKNFDSEYAVFLLQLPFQER